VWIDESEDVVQEFGKGTKVIKIAALFERQAPCILTRCLVLFHFVE
jgi:hypothetical protein